MGRMTMEAGLLALRHLEHRHGWLCGCRRFQANPFVVTWRHGPLKILVDGEKGQCQAPPHFAGSPGLRWHGVWGEMRGDGCLQDPTSYKPCSSENALCGPRIIPSLYRKGLARVVPSAERQRGRTGTPPQSSSSYGDGRARQFRYW